MGWGSMKVMGSGRKQGHEDLVRGWDSVRQSPVRCARYPGIPFSQLSHLHSLSWIAGAKVLALPILTI